LWIDREKKTQKIQKWSLDTAIVLVIYIFSLQNWIGNSTSSSSSSSSSGIGPLIGPLTYWSAIKTHKNKTSK